MQFQAQSKRFFTRITMLFAYITPPSKVEIRDFSRRIDDFELHSAREVTSIR
ncbi:hypothetical protein ACMZ8M_03250 [Gardnerella pickettii]|uniref:hypothetical protein n=1 Tax=Gardnerella pickettii TaxID=2914924 RepID=UPI0039EF10A4